MLLSRLLNPSYHIRVFKFNNLKVEEVIESFRKKGARPYEVQKESDLDLELTIESLLASNYGSYIYLLKFKGDRTFISAFPKEIKERHWPKPTNFIARDENGLKRFLLRELSRKSLFFIEVPTMLIWTVVWLLIWQYFESYPLGSILLFFLGFILNDFAQIFEYFVLGYCKE